MAIKANTVIGYFGKRSDAQQAIDDLKWAGFGPEQLGLATHPDSVSPPDAGGATLWNRVVGFFGSKGEYEYHPEAFRGSLQYAGVTEDRARYFEYQLAHNNTGALVTVSAIEGEKQKEAERIIERHDGDLGAISASFSYPAEVSATTSAASREASTAPRTLQLLGEVLRIHKERVPAGEVRLHKEVVTETQNVQVPVSHEELVIERHPGGESAAPSGQIGKEPEIRVPLTEEHVNVEKRPTVQEEVEVQTRSVENTENVSEEVRHEELHVEKDEKAKVTDEGKPPKARKQSA